MSGGLPGPFALRRFLVPGLLGAERLDGPFELALGFFPGGFGTFDELMEVLPLVQTGKVRKPMGIVLYGSELWTNVINLDLMVEHGVISPEDRDLFVVCDDVEEATAKICGFLEENYGPTLLLEE